jgi:hypothetical protein
VCFIEDKNLETVAGRSKDCALAKIAGIIYTVVAGGIYLDYV